MCTGSLRELEEERRLLYVAITRAEKHCIMTCAQNRFRYGRLEFDSPSRFIKDFDPQLIRVLSEKDDKESFTRGPRETGSRGSSWMQNPHPVATQFRADPKPRAVAPRQPEKPVNPFGPNFKRVPQAVAPQPVADMGDGLKIGDVIEHQRFGIGRVVNLEGVGENQKATVEFRNTGTKQLLLKFARYKIIS
jgi:DNA helicase-2/ATP-dependent DNA helicase PcrA